MTTTQWQFTIEKGVKDEKQTKKTKWYTYIPSVNEEDEELYLHKHSLNQKIHEFETCESSKHIPISKPNSKKSSAPKEFIGDLEFQLDLPDFTLLDVPIHSGSSLILCSASSISTMEHPKNEREDFSLLFLNEI